MILLRALIAVIHACLKVAAVSALALSSLLITLFILMLAGVGILSVLGVTGVGGFRVALKRRRQSAPPSDQPK